MKLFKYIGFSSDENKRRIKSIISDKKIYLSPFEKLNDPFEGTFRFNNSVSYQNNKDGTKALLIINQNSVIQTYTKKRILCLTKNNTSTLMWAHYANSFNGVCLEFNVTQDNLFKEVIYKSTQENAGVFDPYAKSIEWAYEKEYRYISDNDKESLDFEENGISLTGIYFGKPCLSLITEFRPITTVPFYLAQLRHNEGYNITFETFADIKSNNSVHALQPIGS